MPMSDEIDAILSRAKTIAVVGLSPRPERDSHRVAEYLATAGYRILPVNPRVPEVLGQRSYPSVEAIPFPVDLVLVFRRSEAMPEIVEHAIEAGAKAVWMQDGILHEQAAERARAAGLRVVMDTCMRTSWKRLMR